jgi:hypothetical protein
MVIEDAKEKSKEERPLTLFSVDLSHLSPTVQYIVLATGLILFMCLYGYYQELVVYGWFERKLSMFSTFLHFLGCFSFAQIQRNLSKTKAPSNTGCVTPTASSFIPVFTLGTAPPRVALFYYMLLIFVRTGAQGMSNLSMTQINYPAKVLFKSASPIITMIIGLVWFRKSYPMRDFIVVALLVFGLYIFITGDATASPQSTKLGIFYVTLSLFGSAGIPMIQEHCMLTYNSSIEDLLYHTFLGSAIASFLTSCLTGEFLQGVMFLLRTGSLHAWFIMFAFTVFGFIGTNFSAGLTLQYGSLVNGITNTFRKALTLGLSFVLFPERNVVTHQKLLGSAIFFCGLLVRIFSKSGGGKEGSHGKGYKEHSAAEIDVETGVLRSERSIIENKNARQPSLSIHTTYFGNNGSTDFGQLISTDETVAGRLINSRDESRDPERFESYYNRDADLEVDMDADSGEYKNNTPSWLNTIHTGALGNALDGVQSTAALLARSPLKLSPYGMSSGGRSSALYRQESGDGAQDTSHGAAERGRSDVVEALSV